MSRYLFIVLVCWPIFCQAQKEDYTWLSGAASFYDDTFKLNYIQFLGDSFQVNLVDKNRPIFCALGIISDTAGNLLCYTNDIHVYNKNHEIIQNGNDFHSPSQFPFGYPATQSVIILPLSDTQGVYLMLDGVHKDIGTDVITVNLRYSIIDMNLNNGFGKVTQKNITLENSTDTLNIGLHTAVRHGNGKDWWTITTKYESNVHRKYLITAEGIQFHDEQIIGDTVYNGVGYAAFSPNGEWFARYFVYGTTSNPKTAFYLYRFDRCTGQLSTPLRRLYQPPEYYGGVAFSSNSRYAYIAKYTKIYQYDLEAADILASEQLVAEYDGFLDEKGVPTRFFGLLLAPDNKIYGIVPGFNTRYLHVIDQPDLPGDSCNVIQHAIYLPTDNFGTIPNVPYFRLFATDTPCDSMMNTTSPPLLLLAKNNIHVWPVPAANVLHFSADSTMEEFLGLQIFDSFGRVVLHRRDIQLSPVFSIRLDALPAGAYFYWLQNEKGQILKSGKVVKTE